MPALQVRDFPEEMYEQLKDYAAQNHRSIAQQVIVAVEEMLQGGASVVVPAGRKPNILEFDTEEQKAARIKKRKMLFGEIKKLEWIGPEPSSEDIVRLIHEGRAERDERILESTGFYRETELTRQAM